MRKLIAKYKVMQYSLILWRRGGDEVKINSKSCVYYFTILFSLLSVSFSSKAQHPGYLPLADLSKFKTEFAKASKNTLSIKSNFVQEKTLSMLSEKIISKGIFCLKEGKVRMEYNSPFQYIMIINKNKVFVKDGQKENKLSTQSNKIFQQINQLMIDCMQGTALSNTNFTTRVFESKNSFLIELSPLIKGLKELFKMVNIVVDKKNYSVNSIQMQEPSGDNTVIRFTHKELNPTLSDALFYIK